MATQNQIAYWNMRENARHNLATEIETNRANVVHESETKRSNLAREAETYRSNVVREGETNRHNLVTEYQGHEDVVTRRSSANNEAVKIGGQLERWDVQNASDIVKAVTGGVKDIGSAFQSFSKGIGDAVRIGTQIGALLG